MKDKGKEEARGRKNRKGERRQPHGSIERRGQKMNQEGRGGKKRKGERKNKKVER